MRSWVFLAYIRHSFISLHDEHSMMNTQLGPYELQFHCSNTIRTFNCECDQCSNSVMFHKRFRHPGRQMSFYVVNCFEIIQIKFRNSFVQWKIPCNKWNCFCFCLLKNKCFHLQVKQPLTAKTTTC